jgi:hypothetical protein
MLFLFQQICLAFVRHCTGPTASALCLCRGTAYVGGRTAPIARGTLSKLAAEPSFFVVALCFVLMLCAPCSCFVLIGVFGHRSPSTKHEACARTRWPAASGGRSCSQKSGLFVAHGQALSTKHEHKAANYDQNI